MQLADEMDSLLALQDKYQTQQGELKTLMAKLEQQKDAYAQQLAEAQKQAQDYKKTISKQEAIIRAQEAAAARANANTYDGGGTGASGGIASDSYLKDPDCNLHRQQMWAVRILWLMRSSLSETHMYGEETV
mgnify:FL=1